MLWKIQKTRQKCYLWGSPMGLNLTAHQEWEGWWGKFQACNKRLLNASVNQSREQALCTGGLPGKASWKGVGPWDRKGGERLDSGPLELTSSGSSRGNRRGFSDGGLHRSTAVSHWLRGCPGSHEPRASLSQCREGAPGASEPFLGTATVTKARSQNPEKSEGNRGLAQKW